MHIHSGILKFTKKDEKSMRTVLEHSKIDISYGEGGSFNKSKDGSLDKKEITKAQEGIKLIEWILDAYKK